MNKIKNKQKQQKKPKFYTAKYDKVFKTVMCNEDDLSLLKVFLERILNIKINEISLLQPEQTSRYIEERKKLIDVLVKVDKDYIHIELNSQTKNYLHGRNFAFFTEIYSKKVKTAEDYIETEEFLHIDLTYGLSKKEPPEREYFMMDEEKKKYINNFKIIEYNMDKLMSFWYSKNEEEIRRYEELIMLDLEEKDLKKLTEISGGDKFMEEFEKKVTKLNKETWYTPWISDEEDDRKILNSEKKLSFLEGKEKGVAIGKKENQLETAKRMKEEGLSNSLISKITMLSLEEIEKL